MVVEPADTPDARPCVPAAFDRVATEVLLLVHVVTVVTSTVAPSWSRKRAVAVNVWETDLGMWLFGGVTVSSTRPAGTTRTLTRARSFPTRARISVTPVCFGVT